MKKPYLISCIVLFATTLLLFAFAAMLYPEKNSDLLMIIGIITMVAAIITLIIGVLTKEVTTQKERIQRKIILWAIFAFSAICLLYADIMHPVLFEGSNLRDVRLSLLSVFMIVLAFWGVIGLLKKNKEKEIQQIQS